MNLKERSLKEVNNAQAMLQLIEEIPDLEYDKDRWGNEFLSAKSINTIVEDVSFTHSCGCCADSPLLIMPFIKKNGFKIFSSPAQIYIGEKNAYGGGEIVDDSWKEILKQHNIGEKIYDKVEKFIQENLPEEFDN